MNSCSLIHILIGLIRSNVVCFQDILDKCTLEAQDALEGILHSQVPDLSQLDEVNDCDVKEVPAISSTVWVAHLKARMYKARIVAQLNEGEKISADRRIRVAQSEGSAWDVMRDGWTVGITDDVAIKFVDDDGNLSAHFGRIIRIRKAKKLINGVPSQFTEYHKPINLNRREDLKDVFVYCYYYSQVGQTNKYKYDTAWSHLVDVETIIIPVTLNPALDQHGLFEVPADQMSLITRSLNGEVDLDD